MPLYPKAYGMGANKRRTEPGEPRRPPLQTEDLTRAGIRNAYATADYMEFYLSDGEDEDGIEIITESVRLTNAQEEISRLANYSGIEGVFECVNSWQSGSRIINLCKTAIKDSTAVHIAYNNSRRRSDDAVFMMYEQVDKSALSTAVILEARHRFGYMDSDLANALKEAVHNKLEQKTAADLQTAVLRVIVLAAELTNQRRLLSQF